MSEINLKLPSKDQLLWPTLIVSLVMGGGSGVGVVDRWMAYQREQEQLRDAEMEEWGRLESRVAENARQNSQEWRVFSQKINHLQERVATIEGHVGVIYPHTHDPLPSSRP